MVTVTAMPERLLVPKEVAEWLGVSVGWVLDHANQRCRPFLHQRHAHRHAGLSQHHRAHAKDAVVVAEIHDWKQRFDGVVRDLHGGDHPK